MQGRQSQERGDTGRLARTAVTGQCAPPRNLSLPFSAPRTPLIPPQPLHLLRNGLAGLLGHGLKVAGRSLKVRVGVLEQVCTGVADATG